MKKLKFFAAFFLPFILLSIFELVNIFVFSNGGNDFIKLAYTGISIICGYIFLFPLLKRKHQILIGLSYFLGMFVLLMLYGIVFFGMVTGVGL